MKKNRKAEDGKLSRSAFIRSRPRSASADEVVEAGKLEGYDLSRDMVHKVRWQAKKANEKARNTVAKKVHDKRRVKPKTVRVLKANGSKKNGANGGMVADLFAEESSLAAAFGASLKQAVRTEVRLEMQRIMGAVNA